MSGSGTSTVGYRATTGWLLPAAFLVVCTLAAVHFTGRLDIGLYDETAYLQRGIDIDRHGLPGAEMAPLYSGWYRCLQAFIPDAVLRYQVNLGLTIALLPFTLLLLLRTMGVHPVAGMATAALLLFSTLNILNWPRVSVFALIVLLTGLRLFIRAADRDRGWLSLVLSVAAVVFMRPEFALALAGLGACWGRELWLDRGNTARAGLRTFAVAGMLVAGLFLWLGQPFGNGRTIVALGQHYALNRTEATDSDIDPWTNWESIAQAELGTTTSISQAFVHAPDRMLWHIAQNLRGTIPAAVHMAMPAGSRPDRTAWVLLAVMMASLCLRAARKRALGAPRQGRTPLWLIVVVVNLPTLASMVLIHPRAHYLVFPLTLFLPLLIAGAYPASAQKSGMAGGLPTLLAGVALLLLHGGGTVGAAGRPVLTTIEALRALPMDTPMRMLEGDGGYATYLPPGTVSFSAQERATPLLRFLEEEHINVIVASARLTNDWRYRDDPEWQAFTAAGHRAAFERLPVEGTAVHLYVKRSALRTR